jgi:hypothetical protein
MNDLELRLTSLLDRKSGEADTSPDASFAIAPMVSWGSQHVSAVPSPRRALAGFGVAAVLAVAGIGTTQVRDGSVEQVSEEQQASAVLPNEESGTAPEWYSHIAPLVPPAYRHIGIAESNDTYVRFWAVNLDSGKLLDLMVSRVAISPDPSGVISFADAQLEGSFDLDRDNNVTLEDGREVSVSCMVAGSATAEDEWCPVVRGDQTTAEDLRELAISLATALQVSDLPEPSPSIESIPSTEIVTTVQALTGLDHEVIIESVLRSATAASFGGPESETIELGVFAIAGLFPQPVSREFEIARSVEISAHRSTWITSSQGTLLVVTTPLSADPSQAVEVLDRLSTVSPTQFFATCIVDYISTGGGFGEQMSPEQIETLVRYLRSIEVVDSQSQDGQTASTDSASNPDPCGEQLTDEQLKLIVDYVRSISEP